MIKDKLTDLCENGLLQNDFINTFCEMKSRSGGGGSMVSDGTRQAIKTSTRETPRSEPRNVSCFSSSVFLSSLELSDSQVYEPCLRVFLRTASHFCEAQLFLKQAFKTSTRKFSSSELQNHYLTNMTSGDTTQCRMTGVTLHSHVHLCVYRAPERSPSAL